jgi:hypothetical protein
MDAGIDTLALRFLDSLLFVMSIKINPLVLVVQPVASAAGDGAQLESAIRDYLAINNRDPKPFVWT